MDYSKMSLKSLKELVGNISYLGNIKQSRKMRLSLVNGTATYCIYLAPADLSGYNVCPNSKHCKQFCLNASGQNKVDILARGEHSIINQSRIKKTKLFHENRELFMEIMVREIKTAQAYAKKNNLEFSIRINGTSDLSPELFKYHGKNLLELFPNVQFYDYTKVYGRINLLQKYPNYDLTLSYNGYNWDECKKFMDNGGKAAVVFEKQLPETWRGYKVIDANDYDMRYLDPNGTIMGLHYHPVASDYVNGHYVSPNTPFVVLEGQE